MDGRFYLLSIVSIFVALGVGLLMGIHLPGAEVVQVGQEAILADIEESISSLKQETTQLQTRIDEQKNFREIRTQSLQKLIPSLVCGSLSEFKITMMFCENEDAHEQNTAQQQLRKMLNAAGAEVKISPFTLPEESQRYNTLNIILDGFSEKHSHHLIMMLLTSDECVDVIREQLIDLADEPPLIAIWNDNILHESEYDVIIEGVAYPSGQIRLIQRIEQMVD